MRMTAAPVAQATGSRGMLRRRLIVCISRVREFVAEGSD